MTFRALLVEVCDSLFGFRLGMGIVATRAAHLAFALLKAATGVHLFNVTDGFCATSFSALLGYEDRPNVI